MGWASILQSRTDENLIRRAVEVIQRNAAVQKRVIDDLLDMARVLNGKLVIKNEIVDLADVLNAATDSVAPAAAAKDIRLQRELCRSALYVRGDSDRLQQVFWNLLSNSIKFTPQNGSVQLRLAMLGSQAEITVKDSGQGIAPEFLPHVFERFRQGESGTNRQHGGLGLGLAVVRYLVEAHGGRVHVHSEGLGRGATFIVSFPLISGT
jgi:signal transduction histidine kinase